MNFFNGSRIFYIIFFLFLKEIKKFKLKQLMLEWVVCINVYLSIK